MHVPVARQLRISALRTARRQANQLALVFLKAWMASWGDLPVGGNPPTTYAAALSGAFQIDRRGRCVGMRALHLREEH